MNRLEKLSTLRINPAQDRFAIRTQIEIPMSSLENMPAFFREPLILPTNLLQYY